MERGSIMMILVLALGILSLANAQSATNVRATYHLYNPQNINWDYLKASVLAKTIQPRPSDANMLPWLAMGCFLPKTLSRDCKTRA